MSVCIIVHFMAFHMNVTCRRMWSSATPSCKEFPQVSVVFMAGGSLDFFQVSRSRIALGLSKEDPENLADHNITEAVELRV